MFLDGHHFAGLFCRSNHQIFIQRFDGVDVDDPGVDAVCLQQLGSLQRLGYTQAGGDQRNILAFPQHHALAQLKFVIRVVVDHRHSQSPEPQIYRTVMVNGSLHGSLCFHIIRRADDNHPRDSAHEGDILVTLMSGTILTYGNARMSGADLHIQMGITNRIADLLKGTACRKHGKGADERDLACGGKACCDAHHVALSDTTVDMSLRKCFLENTGLGGSGQVRVQNDQIRILCAVLCQRVAVALSCCDFLYF